MSFRGGRGHGGRGRGHGGRGRGGGKTSTTRLPAALAEEMQLNAAEDTRDFSQRFRNKAANRKLQRKQAREDKKKNRRPTLSRAELTARQHHIFMPGAASTNRGKNTDSSRYMHKKARLDKIEGEDDKGEEEDVKAHKKTTKMQAAKTDKESKKSSSSAAATTKGSNALDARRLAKLAKSNPAFYAMLQEDGVVSGTSPSAQANNDEDEMYLRYYEKKLGLKAKDVAKMGSKKSLVDDGLGDLLEGINVGSRGARARAGVTDTLPAAMVVDAMSSRKRKPVSDDEDDDDVRDEDGEEEDDEDESEDSSNDEDEGMESFDSELEAVDPEGLEGLDHDDDDEDMDGMDSFDDELEAVDPEDLEYSDMEGDDAMAAFDDDDDVEEDGSDSEMMEGMEDGESNDSEESDVTNDAEEEEEKNDDSLKTKSSASPSAASSSQPTKYIPPHLRAKMAAEAAAAASTVGSLRGAAELAKSVPRHNTEELQRLRRQLQGLLNKLSESNMEPILMDIEALYRKYPRADVTETITDMIVNSISSKANLLDSFVLLYATVVASLYRLVGIEFAAHFVQTVIEKFEEYHAVAASTKSTEMTDETLEAVKQCTNLIVLVSELYNMSVLSCVLIYDLIRWFMNELSELNVELVVKIVRASGYQLRQDDPTTLKTVIQEFTVLANEAAAKKQEVSSRTRFLLETLTALRQNRMKGPTSNSTTSGTISESTTRMKKFLSGLSKKRTTFPSEPMRVSLEDIRLVGTKGKWWLVGSSWKNNMVGEESQYSSKSTTADDMLDQENELVKLARKNKMNTDVRRSIFVVLMSSEDYLDAFERLLKLNLREVQQREIVRVLLHCAGNEQAYNPYYALVSQRLCQYDHSFKITFQYCLWDLLREMGATDVGGMEKIKNGQVVGLDDGAFSGERGKVPLRRIVNLSKLFGYLVTAQDLSLVMLKTVTFTSLPEQPIMFFQLLLTNVIVSSQKAVSGGADQQRTIGGKPKRDAQALADIFIRAAVNATLAQGIIFFLQAFVKKGQVCQDETEKETVMWGCGVVREVLQSAVKTGGRF